MLSSLFFFTDTATTEIYTLSLHDALPIWSPGGRINRTPRLKKRGKVANSFFSRTQLHMLCAVTRSEEHTSELQSLTNLVCRLLLEKKKKNNSYSITCND